MPIPASISQFTRSNVNDVYTYTLNNNFTTNGWSIIDITQTDTNIQIIIDGNNNTVTINDVDFNGLFYAGNTASNTINPTIIKNLKIKSSVNINVALAKIVGSIEFQNCHLELFSANINSNGGGLAYNNTQGFGLKVNFTLCSAKVFGKIGDNAGPLVGYIASNSGNQYTITNCKTIVSDNNSETGSKTLGSGAGAFVGSGISNTVTINSSYCLFNGSMAYGSGIIGGKYLGSGSGSSGPLVLNNFYAVTNITTVTNPSSPGDIDSSHYPYYLSSYHGGSIPNSISLTNVFLLNLGVDLSYVYGYYLDSIHTLTSTFNGFSKYSDYTTFNTNAHGASVRIGDDTYTIEIGGTNKTFYSYAELYKNNFRLNSSEKTLKMKSTILSGYSPGLKVNSTAYVPPSLPEINSNGLIFFKSSDNSKFSSSRGIVTSITAPPFAASTTKFFSVKFTGYFKTMTAGAWYFELTSDDSSQLYIDGVRVVNNSGTHGSTVQGSSFTVVTGRYYKIEIYYGQQTGGIGLTFQHENPSNFVSTDLSSLFFTDKTSSAVSGLLYEWYEGYYADDLSFFNRASNIYFKTPASGNALGTTFYVSETNEFEPEKISDDITVSSTGTKTLSSLIEYPAGYNKNYGDAVFTLPAPIVSSGDGTMSYISLTPSVITIDSSTREVTIVGAGTGVVVAKISETATYYSYFVCVNIYVSKKSLSISFADGTLVYGSNLVSLITPTGLKSGETITSIVTNIGEKPDFGTYTVNSIVSSTGTGGYLSSNYTITVSRNGSVTISKKPLIIRALDRTIVYGDGLAIGTSSWGLGTSGSPESLVSGDWLSSVTMLFNGSANVPNRTIYGTYTNSIIASNATGGGLTNYEITYAPGTLIVQKKTQVITINAPRQIYKTAGYTKSAIVYSTTLVVADTLKSIDYKFNGSTTVPVPIGTYPITLADNFPTVNYNKLIPYLDTAGTIQVATPLFLLNPSDFKTVINGQTVNLSVDTVLAVSNFTGSTWSEFQPKTEGTDTYFLGALITKNTYCPKYINIGGYINNSYIAFNLVTSYKNYIQKTANTTPLLLATNGGFTAFFLVYFSNTTVGEAIIDFYITATSSRLFIGRDATTANKLNVTLYCGTTLMINVSTTATVFTPGSWNIVGVRITNNGASSVLDIYNLYTKETTTINQTLTNITPTTLNIFKTTIAKYTVGRLGNAYIFNKSLNDKEVTAIIDYLRCVNSNYNYELKDPNGGAPVAEIIQATPILEVTQLADSVFPEYTPSSGGFLGFGQSSQASSFSFSFNFNHDNLAVSLVDELGQSAAPTKTGPTINSGNLTASLTITSYHPGLVKVNLASYSTVDFPQNLQATTNIYFKPKKPSGVSIQKYPNDGSFVGISIDNVYAKTSGVGNYNVNIAYKLSTSNTSFPSDYILLSNEQIVKQMDNNLGIYSGKYIFYVNQILVNGTLENLNYDTTYYIKFVLRINGASSVESDIISFTTGFAGTNFKDSVTINNRRYTMSPENFSNKNYSSKDLTGIVIGGGNISNVLLNGVTMNETIDLIYANVNNLNVDNSKFHSFNIRYSTITNSSFVNSTFENSQIGDSSFTNCNFSQLKLQKFNYGSDEFVQNEFYRLTFDRCNFNDSILYGATYRDITMDVTTDPSDIRTRETMKNTLISEPFDFYYYPDEKIIDFRKCQTIEEQNTLSRNIRNKQLESMDLSYNAIPKNRGSILIPPNEDLLGSSRSIVITTGALTSIDAATVSTLAALAGQEDFTSDIGGISGNLSGLVPGTVYLATTYGTNQQPQLYPRGYQTTARAASVADKPPGQIHDEFVADFITTVYGPKPHTNAATNGDVIEYTSIFMGAITKTGTNNFLEATQTIPIDLKGGRTDDYANYQYLVIKHDVNGNPYVLENTIAPKTVDANGKGIFTVSLQTGKLYVLLAIPYGVTPNASSASQDADRFYVDDTGFPTSIDPVQFQAVDLDPYVKNRTGYSVKTKINFNAVGNAIKSAGKFANSLSSVLKIMSTGSLTIEFILPASIAFNEQKITKTITVEKTRISSNADITAGLKTKLSTIRQNADLPFGNQSLGKFLIQQSGVLSADLEVDGYINDFATPTTIQHKPNIDFTLPAQCAVFMASIDQTTDLTAFNTFKARFENNGRVIKEIIKFTTDATSGILQYKTPTSGLYLAGHVNPAENDFDATLTPTVTQVGADTIHTFTPNAFSYWIIFETIRQTDVNYYTSVVISKIKSGGDPIIHPLIGPKYSLAPHINFVNLLADYSTNTFINSHIDMLKPSDFPTQVYWDKSFSNITDLKHIYTNTYYRRFFIYYAGEAVEIDADTLEVNKLTKLNKIKVANYKPKTGIKSISFDKTYPLTDATKGIKIGFGNLILTLISDINTDDRHYLELFNAKNYSLIHMSGALISKDQILRISNLAGPELFEYKSNPFLITKPN